MPQELNLPPIPTQFLRNKSCLSAEGGEDAVVGRWPEACSRGEVKVERYLESHLS